MEIKVEEQTEQPDNSVFSINTWFNDLPIRIIGTPEEPFFYATDIGTVLNIKQISVAIKKFDETEIVAPITRDRHNLITYRKYKNEMRRNDKIVLLTEFGVYRLIINSRSDIGMALKTYIYEIIRTVRRDEQTRLNVINSENVKLLNDKIAHLETFAADIQKYNPSIYVFCITVNGNPRDIILPEDRDPYVGKYFKDKCKKLYKITTKPNANDYTSFNLIAKIYGDSDEIMDSLFEDTIDINPVSLEYCRYIMDFNLDCLNCKIIMV